MNASKCAVCELVNFRAETACRRCAAPLTGRTGTTTTTAAAAAEETPIDDGMGRKRRGSLVGKAFTVGGLAGFLLFICYVSLIATSNPLTFEQQGVVRKAVAVLAERGFATEVLVLRRVASFRASDNWWNRYMGHGDAYAATNFPFEVVTLYPDFFEKTSDDTERAVILLHEYQHLTGRGEKEAFTAVWRVKGRLGWTDERYGRTRVWRNVAEFTRKYAPKLFRCGDDGTADCVR